VKLKASILILASLFLFVSQTIPAQNRPPSFPRLQPDPKALEYFGLNSENRYTWQELAEISLWASGDASASNMAKISAAVEQLKSSPDLPSSSAQRAEYILSYMHNNILRSYSLYQTQVDTIFTNGRYNCVSSAVLYMIFCEALGVSTRGVMTRDHAFIRVLAGGTDYDVETTNRYGFDPGNRKEFHDTNGNLTGFAYVPPQNYRDRQLISQIELISLIFINRIADHERQSRYADSVPVAIDRAALLLGSDFSQVSQRDSSESILEDPGKVLIDRLINYGASLLRANREEDGILWAEAASARYANGERWSEFLMAAINNRITRFLREREANTTSARNFLEDKKNLLSTENYAQLDTILVDAEILKRANQIRAVADGDSIIEDTQNARDSGRLAERRANELIVYAVQKTAALLCSAPARDWRSAINYIEAFISRFGEGGAFEQALSTYRGNLATEYHNRFAAEWNRRNFDEAERILNEGIAEFPNNRQLLTDRETVNRNRR